MGQEIAKRPTDRLKEVMASPTVQEQFRNALGENSGTFVASLIDLYAGDTHLQNCEPRLVVMEALKAATLRLPINRSLGFAWIIPYNKSKKVDGKWIKESLPQFQPGWKGIIQLAQRTGQYKYINCGPVFDGELKGTDKLSGAIDISGEPNSEKVVGYFAYIELISGFTKASFWPVEKIKAHAIKYNPQCKKEGKLVGVWLDHFDSRAMATVLKHLITKYGPMSVDMADVMAKSDDEEYDTPQREIDMNANQEELDINDSVVDAEWSDNGPELTEAEKAEIAAAEAAQATGTDGPGF